MKPWRPHRKRGLHSSKRRTFSARTREYLWPSMGMVSFCRWLYLKLIRQSSQPYAVAMGLATGVMVSFFPVLGTHTVLVFLLTLLFRASFMAALVGTMLANPWTIGPMWAASFKLGKSILHIQSTTGLSHLHSLSFTQLLAELPDMLAAVIIPTMVGGLVIGGPLAFLTYIVVYWRLRTHRAKHDV
ncbi:MAG: hypothetical protein DI585_05815 [Pseudomonas fluorescens]|nr:MAG: hypothetical protein DI585_05815 [Pseudomonas fluorescens]